MDLSSLLLTFQPTLTSNNALKTNSLGADFSGDSPDGGYGGGYGGGGYGGGMDGYDEYGGGYGGGQGAAETPSFTLLDDVSSVEKVTRHYM